MKSLTGGFKLRKVQNGLFGYNPFSVCVTAASPKNKNLSKERGVKKKYTRALQSGLSRRALSGLSLMIHLHLQLYTQLIETPGV